MLLLFQSAFRLWHSAIQGVASLALGYVLRGFQPVSCAAVVIASHTVVCCVVFQPAALAMVLTGKKKACRASFLRRSLPDTIGLFGGLPSAGAIRGDLENGGKFRIFV